MKRFHPMALLLKFEGYPPAFVASLVLHACLVIFVLGKSVSPSDYMTVEDPVIITASAIDVNPQRLRRLERLELERVSEARRQEEVAARERREREARQQAEREESQRRQQEQAERERQEELARQQRDAEAEAERQRLAEEARAREAREAEERLRDQQRQAREQAAREAQSNQVAAENLIVAEYSARIRQVISQNWQRPPSARNGMTSLVRVQLVPTGEVVGVTILQSSGDAAYDRSVLQAVERAERFPELQDLGTAVFERNFRSFNLLFRPEDLLR